MTPHWLIGVQADDYWSSTSNSYFPEDAWSMDMGTYAVMSRGKWEWHWVWPVRAYH